MLCLTLDTLSMVYVTFEVMERHEYDSMTGTEVIYLCFALL